MHLIWQGFLLGLWLSILVGPILFVFLQVGIEKGFRAAFMVGLGVWFSDLLFIVSVYFGVHYILELLQVDNFETTIGLIGGVLLMGIGLGQLLSNSNPMEQQLEVKTSASYPQLFLKGFAVNSFNPFPLVFWSSVMTTHVAKGGTNYGAIVLLGSILLTIVLTDMLKIGLAKRLQRALKAEHIFRLRKIAGIVIIIFGVVLMGKVLFWA